MFHMLVEGRDGFLGNIMITGYLPLWYSIHMLECEPLQTGALLRLCKASGTQSRSSLQSVFWQVGMA